MTRETTPVDSTPLAITSIAAMVMTPPLLSPENSSAGVAIPRTPAASNATISARTAGIGRWSSPPGSLLRVPPPQSPWVTIVRHPDIP